MTIADSLFGLLGLRPERSFCKKQFPSMWDAFTDHLVDYGFTGHTCASPEQAGVHEATPTVLPAAERLIAIGDLHGDLGKTRRVFRAAGLTDDEDRWIGGNVVCVQVGDILDRGDAELRVLYFLESLQAQARAAGGALHVLNGNHETMNVMGNHRYATPGATREIDRWNQWQRLAARLKTRCGCTATTGPTPTPAPSRASPSPPAALSLAEAQGMFGARHFVRTFAMQPGSVVTRRFFATHPTVLQVGSTVFVHGGVLEQHVEYGIDKINQETSAWMRGEASAPGDPTSTSTSTTKPLPAPMFLRGADAVVWARNYSAEDGSRCECEALERVLKGMPGASRMVMGHTIQSGGVNAACDGMALRVDVGLSRGCGNGEVEALEILKDGEQVRRVREGLPTEDVSRPLQAAPEPTPAATEPQPQPRSSPWWSWATASNGQQPPVASPA